LGRSRLERGLAGLVSATVVLVDLWLVWRGHTWEPGLRVMPALIALCIYIALARGDQGAVGLRLRPVQGVRFWLLATLVIAGAVGAVIAISVVIIFLSGRTLPLNPTAPHEIWAEFVRMCVVAPLVEETIYRLGFCPGAVSVLGRRWTIAANGLSFGILHVLYHNPGPDNLVSGFFLAWAYLKSGSIFVPVALHGLGNLCVLASRVAAWYWLT
jgi:membrane protease YdiL (CAAX protease family)